MFSLLAIETNNKIMKTHKYKILKKSHKSTCRSIHTAHIKFKKYLGVNAIRFMDPLMTAVTGKYSLNVVSLDDWLHQQGYAEEIHGSMKEYICKSYGKDAMDFIISLLIMRPKKISRRIKKR